MWKSAILFLPHCCYCLVTKVASNSCNPMGCSLPDSSVHGIPQAKILEWAAISFSREPSWPRESSPHFLHWQEDSLPLSHLGSPFYLILSPYFICVLYNVVHKYTKKCIFTCSNILLTGVWEQDFVEDNCLSIKIYDISVVLNVKLIFLIWKHIYHSFIKWSHIWDVKLMKHLTKH